jgi:hypothetical protein
LPLQVVAEIKDAGISIDHRPVQLHHDFQTITRPQRKRLEDLAPFRIVEKFA